MFRLTSALGRTLALGACVLVACASNKQGTDLRAVKPPAPPASVPATWDFTDASALPRHQGAAMAACEWLLSYAPATSDSKSWVRTRDFALDWIEATPSIVVTQPIVAYVATDRRFMYGVYMRGAYQCGKASWVLAHPGGDALSFEAELAGINAMRQLMGALQDWDPHTGSPRLDRLGRAEKNGKLEAKLTKIVAKNKGGGGRKRR